MSDRILSQDEISSLLGAVDKGEIDLNADENEAAEIKPYDITSQSIKLLDHFQALEEIYDKFVTLLRTSLSSSLQRDIEVEFVSTEMVKFKDFLTAFSNPTNFSIFTLEPLIGSALFAVEAELVFSLIDCMFGGNGKPLSQSREFTPIEMRMMRRFTGVVLEDLEKAWKPVYPLKPSFKKIETKPEYVHLFVPDDLVLITVFLLNGQEFSGNIHLCISYLMLEPIKDKLSAGYLIEKGMENTWTTQMQDLLGQAQVTISAELGSITSNIRDISNLHVGDVLSLTTGPQSSAIIKVEGIPKFHGLPGTYKGNSSVQITELLRHNGGAKNHGHS